MEEGPNFFSIAAELGLFGAIEAELARQRLAKALFCFADDAIWPLPHDMMVVRPVLCHDVVGEVEGLLYATQTWKNWEDEMNLVQKEWYKRKAW